MTGKSSLASMVVKLENPSQEAAEKRAEEILARCQLNEAILTIGTLLEEVATMPIARRFNSKRKAFRLPSLYPLSMQFKDLSEIEYKRKQLELHLNAISGEILLTISRIYDVVMDIEATKIDE